MLRRTSSRISGRSSVLKATANRPLKFEGLESRTMLTVASATGDFNGDGRDDLAVGLADKNVNGLEAAGEVQVRYGGNSGLSNDEKQTWTLDSTGVNGHAERHDGFGTSLAVGDFNRDGYDDLAIGTPGKTVSGKQQAGAVIVLYGSAAGLRAAGAQFWSQDSQSINSHARANEHFGAALAAGDFNGNRIDDLAIGTPGESGGTRSHSGVVNVIFGSRSGLHRAHDQLLWHIDRPAEGIVLQANSKSFGSVLAAGDFNRDGFDELVVTIPEYTSMSTSTKPNLIALNYPEGTIVGVVDIIDGSRSGLDLSTIKSSFSQSPSYFAYPTSFNRLNGHGAALAVGDFNGDGFDDLAVSDPRSESPRPYFTGVYWPPGTEPPFYPAVGRVYLAYGSEQGIGKHGKWFSHSFTPWDVGGVPTDADIGFGRSLTAGDFDRDGVDDLVIGAAATKINGQVNAGTVAVIYGKKGPLDIEPLPWTSADGGLTGRREIWHQNIDGLTDEVEVDNYFGTHVATGDFNGDGYADLAVEVPGENDVGATAVIYGTKQFSTPAPDDPLLVQLHKAGLNARNNQLWF
jgi:hypothetical protein